MPDVTELLNIEVPGNVFVHCPKTGDFRAIGVAKNCIGCAHFLGMVDVDVGTTHAPGSFINKYRVQCAHPVSRRMGEVSL